ncbi:MAG: IreB family regulatory phosphoprotein [Anaerovoracaceae bacterium]
MDKKTILFTTPQKAHDKTVASILTKVYDALEEKGYNAIDQIVGYILSGDPSYITAHNNARGLIRQIDRDDLVETLLRNFLNK